MRLEKKVAIVTGAAMGIGRAVAELFAREGAMIIIADIAEQKGQTVAREISSAGGDCMYLYTDVGDDADVRRLVGTAVERFGRLDILVNNAAISLQGTVVDTTPEDWHRVINVNLGGVYRGCRLAIPHMIASGGGSIVNLASVQGLAGFPGWAAYAASKGGIIALTRQIAMDYASNKVRVNCICPGTIMTPMVEQTWSTVPDRAAALTETLERHPIGRIGQPEDIANAALYLASEESSFVTGHMLVVDGGLTASGW